MKEKRKHTQYIQACFNLMKRYNMCVNIENSHRDCPNFMPQMNSGSWTEKLGVSLSRRVWPCVDEPLSAETPPLRPLVSIDIPVVKPIGMCCYFQE
jgi:hypothetical protein